MRFKADHDVITLPLLPTPIRSGAAKTEDGVGLDEEHNRTLPTIKEKSAGRIIIY